MKKILVFLSSKLSVIILSVFLLPFFAGCSSGGGNCLECSGPQANSDLLGIYITPGQALIPTGDGKVQLRALGSYSDGRDYDITNSVIWSSDDTTVATVSSSSKNAITGGLVSANLHRAVTATCNIKAIFGQKTTVVPVTVNMYTPPSDIPMVNALAANTGAVFTMGMDASDGTEVIGQPAHTVTLTRPFAVGKYQVTQALYRSVMENNIIGLPAEPSWFTPANGFSPMDTRPVESVSYNELCSADGFFKRLNEREHSAGRLPVYMEYRLPTEAEWEFAAKGGETAQPFTYSGSNVIADVCWYTGNSSATPHAVGSKQANALGFFDFSGNVYEFCSDWFVDYTSDSQTDPKGPASGTHRVVRGGAYLSADVECTVIHRDSQDPDAASSSTGFRIVCSEK